MCRFDLNTYVARRNEAPYGLLERNVHGSRPDLYRIPHLRVLPVRAPGEESL